jgi:D-serine deaminase-like pyridoxal phosphate-dependent protein
VGSAEALVAGGVRNILITNEIVGPAKIARLIALCRSADMSVVVDDADNVAALSAAARRSGVELGVLVEVNVRLDRCGVAPGQAAVELAGIVADSPGLQFRGLMGYEGTIRLLDFEQRALETKQAIDKLLMTKGAVEQAGLPVKTVSAGGTSTWNITSTFPGVTEIQPGSYIFMDGASAAHTPDFETALFMLTTVISRKVSRKAICDVGLTALTANGGMPVVRWPAGAKLLKLDQEHAHLSLDSDGEQIRVGDKVAILPSHGETTINLHDYLFGLREGVLESVFELTGRGRFR